MKKPQWIAPMLATLVAKPFSDQEWIFEEKLDGIRCIAIKKSGKVTLYSRNKKLLNASFPEIVEELEAQKSKNYIADGEIVTFRGKITSFSQLQSRLNVLNVHRVKGPKVKVFFYIFDLPFWDHKDLRKYPVLERKEWLKQRFPFGKFVRYTPHILGAGEAYFKKAARRGLEGIIAKRKGARYLSKRSRDWLKIKCNRAQEFVILGYTDPQGDRKGFGALLVGYYENKKLRYAGKVGTGYDREMLQHLSKQLKALEVKHSISSDLILEKQAHFVPPKFVCEVGFTEWTKGGKLRHPRFLGLRKDKPAKQVKRER